MKDVAAEARVSVQTVSNLIHGRYEQMSEDTRARVAEAMGRLEYHPDATAQSLRSARTRTLGFLVLDEHKAFLADPLTAQLLAGVGDVARGRRFGILVQGGSPDGDDVDFLTPFRERRIDGAFVLLSGDPAVRRGHVERLGELGAPFVLFDEVLEDGQVLSVRAADREGGRLLTQHLLERGHDRIAFLGARVPWAVIEQRYLGYRDALAAAGVRPTKRLERFEASGYATGGEEIARRLLALRPPPTAVICANDLLALEVIRALRDDGRRVPDDMAVAGFDDFVFSALVDPALTTVSVPAYEMGQTAAAMLLDRIDGREPLVRQAVFGIELRVRAST